MNRRSAPSTAMVFIVCPPGATTRPRPPSRSARGLVLLSADYDHTLRVRVALAALLLLPALCRGAGPVHALVVAGLGAARGDAVDLRDLAEGEIVHLVQDHDPSLLQRNHGEQARGEVLEGY